MAEQLLKPNMCRIATWNIRGLSTSTTDVCALKVEAIAEAADEQNLQVLALTETWIRNDDEDRMVTEQMRAKGWRWIGRHRKIDRKAKRGSGGVGIMVKQDKAAEEADRVVRIIGQDEEDILWVQAKIAGRRIRIGVFYLAPQGTTSGRGNRADKFLLGLTENQIEMNRNTILLGDFNARVGQGVQNLLDDGEDWNVSYESIDEVISTRGKRMLQVCQELNMVIATGTRGKASRFTCETTNGASIVDHICMSRDVWSITRSVGVVESLLAEVVDSDHNMVCAEIKYDEVAVKTTKRQKTKRWDTEDRGRSEHWTKLQEEVQNSKGWWEQKEVLGCSVQEQWQNFRTWADEMLRKGVGCNRKRRQAGKERWLSVDKQVLESRKNCKVIYRKIAKHPKVTRQDRDEVKTLWKQHARQKRHRRKRARTVYWSNKRAEMKRFEQLRATDPKTMWRYFKQLMGKAKGSIQVPKSVKDQDGTMKQGSEAEQVWTEEWKALGKQDMKDPAYQEDFAEKVVKNNKERQGGSKDHDGGMLDNSITLKEVKAAIKRLRRGKASGTDGIPNEFMMKGGAGVVEVVWKLVQKVWREEEIPDEWAEGLVVPLYKGDDPQKVNNYRGITLLNTVGKVFCSILDYRLTKFCEGPDEPKLEDEQGGFRPWRSCEDLILVLNELINRRRHKKLKTFCCFIDIRKAYDGVFREGLWEKMWQLGIKGKMWRVIRELYRKTKSRMMINGKKLDEFEIEQGVRQGCVLSPKLFSIFFNDLVKAINDPKLGEFYKGLGLKIDPQAGDDERLRAMFYADDIVLMAESAEHLQALINRVQDYSEKWRFKLNQCKSQVVVFNSTKQERVKYAKAFALTFKGDNNLPRVPLKVVDHYKYLGVEMVTGATKFKMYKKRVAAKARTAFYSVRAMGVAAGYMSVAAGEQVWKSLVRSRLEYAAVLMDDGDSKPWEEAEVIQRRMARTILGVPKTTTSLAVLGELGWWPLKARRDMLRLRYWAKLVRMYEGRCTKKMYKVCRREAQDPMCTYRNWCHYTKELLEDLGMSAIWRSEKVPVEWKAKVFDAIQARERKRWSDEVPRFPALRAYTASMKEAPAKEEYLQDDNASRRRAITRLRLGCADLELVLGRRSRVDRWDRVCKYCEQVKGTRVVEDEYHFLTQCPLYQRHRAELQKKVGWSLDKKSCSEVEKTVQTWMKNGINAVGSYPRNSGVARLMGLEEMKVDQAERLKDWVALGSYIVVSSKERKNWMKKGQSSGY